VKKYLKMLREAEGSLRFWTHKAMREFTIGVIMRMDERGTSRAQLAETLKVSPAYVSKVLRGDVNLTLESMVKLARAVGGRLSVSITEDRRAVTASNVAVALPVAVMRANSAVVSNATVVQGEQTTHLLLPQLASSGGTGATAYIGTNHSGQDDVFLLAA
jgi:transcriptional regulator with XRE-family HTH domain